MTQDSNAGMPIVVTSSPDNLAPHARSTFMVSWAVSESFGGMTAMCLKRAGLFHEAGFPSAVVTFDANPDYAGIRERLIREGRLHPEVPIVNLHDYYATHTPAKSSKPPIAVDTSGVGWKSVDVVKRTADSSIFFEDFVFPGNDELKRREYYRPDGTLYLVDCMLPKTDSDTGVRRVLQLFRRGRIPVIEFSSAAKLYRHWLSEIVGDSESNVIVDSKFSAGFLSVWSHPGATKVFNFHGSHVAAGADPLTGKLSRAHVTAIENRSSWDALVFLTDSQRQAFIARFGDQGNTFVVSNPADGPAELPPRNRRNPTRVVYVGRLTANKNVDQIIDIVGTVARTGQAIELDILGEGEQRQALEKQVADLGLGEIVHFRGHVASVGQYLSTASVLLLCSRHEGQSLAILEAQAYGCVPVAYDVDFGPREVIKQGETGYLVEYGDTAAAAGTVIRLLVNEELASSMSARGFEQAQDFTSPAISRRWQETLELARGNQRALSVLGLVKPYLGCIRFRPDGQLEVDIDWEEKQLVVDSLHLVISARGSQDPGQAQTIEPSEITGDGATFLIPAGTRSAANPAAILDLSLGLRSGSAAMTIRLGPRSKPDLLPYLTAYGNLSLK